MKRALFALFAASLIAAPAAAQPMRCLKPEEAESLALVALPDILRETARICTTALPPSAFVRANSAPLIAKYQAEADRAWPAAQKALLKLTDPIIEPLLNTQVARQMLTTLAVSQIVGRIDVGDCGKIDRMASLLQPLPPRNTAGLIVTALQYLKEHKANGKIGAKGVPDLPICAEPKP
ncbi:hypothetical protein [Sphingomonas sp. GB1N7]|uniref:hypothetical protein n=1 Tax=Parasphingomonas caseinilytica TaxID=3096158 RepID=UPI002FC97943